MSNNEYMRVYVLDRYYKRRTEWIEKLGGKCVVCGATENLEFDHVDEASKEYEIGSILATHSEAKVSYEMGKCQLLCERHHMEKTAKFNSVDHGGGLTGKRNCYCDLCAPLKRKYNYEKKYKKEYTSKKAPYICGTYRTYKHGCKCSECKAANTKYIQELRKKKAS